MRDNLIDSIKAFAIILVILGHSIQFNIPENFDSDYLFRIIYSFHMPLFMFISGYVTIFSKKPNLKSLARKAKTLLLPYLSWAFINYFIFHYGMSFYEYQKMVINEPDNALWFLYVLFFCHLTFYFLNKIPSHFDTWIGIIISIPIMLLPFHSFGFNLFKWYFFFFIIGRGVSEYKNHLRIKNSLIILSVPLFFFLSYFWHRTMLPNFFLGKPVSALIYKLAVPCLGIISTFSIFKAINIQSDFWSKVIGRKTLEIYIAHFLFIFPCVSILKGHMNTWLAIVLTCIISLFCSLLFAKLVKQNKILSLFLFGK